MASSDRCQCVARSRRVAVVVGDGDGGRIWMNWINKTESTVSRASCSSQSRELCIGSRPASLHNWIDRCRYGSGSCDKRATAETMRLLLPSPSKFMCEPARRRTEIVLRSRLSPSLCSAVNDRYHPTMSCLCHSHCCWGSASTHENLVFTLVLVTDKTWK